MVLKTLFTGQQWRNRHREQTYGHRERGAWQTAVRGGLESVGNDSATKQQQSMHVNATVSIPPSGFFPTCGKPVLCVRISIPALQTGSSVPPF